MSATLALIRWHERPQWNPVPPAQFWEFATPGAPVEAEYGWSKTNPHLWSMYFDERANQWRGLPPVPGSETLAWQLGLDAWRDARRQWRANTRTPALILSVSYWIQKAEEKYGFVGSEWLVLFCEGWKWGRFNETLY